MIYEGVNFYEDVIKKMSYEEFEASHLKVYWLDCDEATRKKMLKEVYESIVKPAAKKSNK